MDTLDTVVEGAGRAEPSPSYAEALTAYLDRMNAAEAVRHAKRYPSLAVPSYVIAGRGRKFDRVARVGPAERSAVAFVEKATGKIWKPASWKSPALNFPRGDIFALPERPEEGREDFILHLTEARW